MMIYSPLEQFEISPIMMYFFGDAASTSATKIHVYAFSTGMLALATAVIALVIFLEFSTFSIRVVPRPWQILGEKVYGFVYSDIASNSSISRLIDILITIYDSITVKYIKYPIYRLF